MIREFLRGLGVAVAEELTRMRWLVQQVVGAAIRLSETEILAATKNLTGIQQEARRHVEDLEGIVKRTGGERQVAVQVIEHQSQFCDQAMGLLRQQRSCAERAMVLTTEIDNFVGTIGKIANAVRILTINGHIESTRLGNEGRAFAVIAQQMRELSEEVRVANERIKDLTAGLGKLIPVIVENSRGLLSLTEKYSSEHLQAVSDFQTAVDGAQQGMTQALYETRERAQRLLHRTGQIMIHMQFQDRMAQNLRDIEHITVHTEKILKTMMERLVQGQPDAAGTVDEGAGSRALTEARLEHPQRESSRLGQERTPDKAHKPDLVGGDVLMFS